MEATTETVKSHVEKLLNERPIYVERLQGGAVNQVFRAILRRGAVVVRIPRRETGSTELLVNRWCANSALANGVPAARVLSLSTSGTVVAIEQCLPGADMGQSFGRSLPSRHLLRQIGLALQRLHSIRISGFGRIDPLGKGSERSWADFVLRPFENREILLNVLAQEGLLEGWELEGMLTSIRSEECLSGCEKPVLLHGDLWFANIMVDRTTLSGFVDWGDATAGDSLYDLIRFELLHGEEIALSLASVSPHLPVELLRTQKAKGYRLRLALEAAFWRILGRDQIGAAKACEFARAALRMRAN
jgi:aminoglycoside phosphotransferase (APT) family kinase protein